MRNGLFTAHQTSRGSSNGAATSVAFWLSLLLHVGILVLVFGDFNFWSRPKDIREVVIEAVILPDAAEGEVEKIAKRDPIPPPPPPPPKPPAELPPKSAVPTAPQAEPPQESPVQEEQEVQEVQTATPSPPEEVANAEEFSQSVLKTLEELQAQTPQGEDDETVQKPLSGIAKNIPDAVRRTVGKAALNAEETQALRQALAECWSIAAGAGDIGGLRVEVRISLLPDGSLAAAEVVDKGRMKSDAGFRAAAEDAIRALYHPKCRRLPLPPEKYESWKVIIFEFDPRQMLG